MTWMRQVKADGNYRIRLALFQFNWLLLSSSTVKKMQQTGVIFLSLRRDSCFSYCWYTHILFLYL